jgi:hypothetical protein
MRRPVSQAGRSHPSSAEIKMVLNLHSIIHLQNIVLSSLSTGIISPLRFTHHPTSRSSVVRNINSQIKWKLSTNRNPEGVSYQTVYVCLLCWWNKEFNF